MGNRASRGRGRHLQGPPGSPPASRGGVLDAVPPPRSRCPPIPPLRPGRHGAGGSRVGGQSSVQCRARVGVDNGWDGGDGGLHHGRTHDELRCGFGSVQRGASHQLGSLGDGEDAPHLPGIRRSRSLCSPTEFCTLCDKGGLFLQPTVLEVWQGVETKEPSYFITKANQERLARARELNLVQLDYTKYSTTTLAPKNGDLSNGSQKPEFETVGCVAVDLQGNCAAATSTGGLVNKMVGRIGDTPVVGAGNYANHLCAVSATGQGEAIIKATVSREVAAIMEYRKVSLAEAVNEVIEERLPVGMGGLVAVSATGDVVMAFNTTGMYRACMKEGGSEDIGIWH